jgi:hypothetical protein
MGADLGARVHELENLLALGLDEQPPPTFAGSSQLRV